MYTICSECFENIYHEMPMAIKMSFGTDEYWRIHQYPYTKCPHMKNVSDSSVYVYSKNTHILQMVMEIFHHVQ